MARTAEGPLVCPRCEDELNAIADFAQACAHPADTGVSLDSMNERLDLSPPINPWENDETRQRLQRIGRQLRTAYRHDPGPSTTQLGTRGFSHAG